MCKYPWSNRDLFLFVEDCSIYQPIHIFFNVLILVEAAASVCFGIYHYHRRKRKDLSLSAIALGIFMMTNFLIILGGNITYADRNWGLNIIHAIALCSMYVNASLHSLRHLEVLTTVDQHTVEHSRRFHTILLTVNQGILVLTMIAQFFRMLIPTGYPSVNFVVVMGSFTLVFYLIALVPRIVYAYQLRKVILTLLGSNPGFYSPIKTRLEGQIKGFIFGVALAFVFNLPWITLPSWHRHSYIIYNLWLFIVSSLGLVNLADTTRSKEEGKKAPELSSTRNEGSKQDTHKSRNLPSTQSEKPNKEIEPPLIEENAPLVEDESLATPRGLESPSKSSIPSPQGTTPEVVTGSFPFNDSNATDQSNRSSSVS